MEYCGFRRLFNSQALKQEQCGEILKLTKIIPLLVATASFPSFFFSYSLPDVLCDHRDLIWRQGTPFELIIGRTAFIDGLLAEISLSCKINARGSVHSPRYHPIIILIISRQMWLTQHSGQVEQELVAPPPQSMALWKQVLDI